MSSPPRQCWSAEEKLAILEEGRQSGRRPSPHLLEEGNCLTSIWVVHNA
jgi:hypothetical protein